MNIFDVAWLAGLVDGEGCISSYAHSNGCSRSVIHTFCVRMTHLPTIKEVQRIIHEITGRRYSIGEHPFPGHPDWKLQHTIQIGRRAAVLKLCETLLPFLRTKKEQAEIVLELCRGLTWQSHSEDREWAFSLVERLKTLNRKGIPSQAGAVPEGVETRRSEPEMAKV